MDHYGEESEAVKFHYGEESEAVKDNYGEESEASAYKAGRTDESFLIQKPAIRAKLEARADSLQGTNPGQPSGLMFRDGKKRIDYILVYRKSSPLVEKRVTFERNLRAEGLMLEKVVGYIYYTRTGVRVTATGGLAGLKPAREVYFFWGGSGF
ncbi:unnamed protein product [Oncorhynchus mykiss]|uniref:Anoctamin dimerisation domain-containing protein n=1 Tax=Oncorhynchus mykiss TaxID=8022 RepID=A0A060ZAS9_ONCMY|nr:unnamed protein product [Oncorhynchus mykiss]